MLHRLKLRMKVTIKSRKSRVLFASLIFVLLVGLSGWTSNNAGPSIVPECGDPQACSAVGCDGGFTLCASMPCDWCEEGSDCFQATMICTSWVLP